MIKLYRNNIFTSYDVVLDIPDNFTGIAVYESGTKCWYLNGKEVTEEQHKLFEDILRLKKLI